MSTDAFNINTNIIVNDNIVINHIVNRDIINDNTINRDIANIDNEINHIINDNTINRDIINNIDNEIVYIDVDLITEINNCDDANRRKTGMSYYKDYVNNQLILEKCKIPMLKEIAKKNRLHISGTKPVLIKRISQYFIETKHAICIQRIFRGHVVRYSFQLRGPMLHLRNKCVNVTDGYTLEPLDEIPYEKFFSYIDSKDFAYGFDVLSLVSVFNTKGKIANPYNMELMDHKTVNRILSLGKILQIAFPYAIEEYEKKIIQKCVLYKPPGTLKKSREQERILLQNQIQMHLDETEPVQNVPIMVTQTETDRHARGLNLYLQYEWNNKMESIRSKPIHTRIQELFIEIDLLGNYTQSTWFSELTNRDYYRFYRYIYDLWNYRGQLMDNIKKKICQWEDPFHNSTMPYYFMDSPIEDLQTICIKVMENMVYGGIDDEFRKIGTLHVLSVLTLVSPEARNNMMWLYESLL